MVGITPLTGDLAIVARLQAGAEPGWLVCWAQREGDLTLYMENRRGIVWADAPLPRRWHRCTAWTRGYLGPRENVERCACGSIRLSPRNPWIEKNARRKSRRTGSGHRQDAAACDERRDRE